MKLSQISKEQIGQLSDAQLKELVYGDLCDRGEAADVALLLGTSPEHDCTGRALCAAQIYLQGRMKYIIPSGGVEHAFPEGNCTEAEHMQRILLETGVPAGAILLENEARTTKENMICGTFQLNRKLLIQNVRSVMIVTSAVHMRRSLALARLFLPRSIRITCSCAPDAAGNVEQKKLLREDVIREAQLMQDLIRQGLMEDIGCQDA